MSGKFSFFDLIFWGLGEQLEEVITLTFFKTKMSLLSGAEHSLIPGWHRVREGSTNLLTGRSLSATTKFFSPRLFSLA